MEEEQEEEEGAHMAENMDEGAGDGMNVRDQEDEDDENMDVEPHVNGS